MLTLLRLQMTILLQPSNNLIDSLLGSHLVKLLLKISNKNKIISISSSILTSIPAESKNLLAPKKWAPYALIFHWSMLKLQLRLQLLYSNGSISLVLWHILTSYPKQTICYKETKIWNYVTLVFSIKSEPCSLSTTKSQRCQSIWSAPQEEG